MSTRIRYTRKTVVFKVTLAHVIWEQSQPGGFFGSRATKRSKVAERCRRGVAEARAVEAVETRVEAMTVQGWCLYYHLDCASLHAT